MIAAFLSWLYQIVLAVLKNGRKSLSNNGVMKQQEQLIDVVVSSTPAVVIGSPTPIVVDNSTSAVVVDDSPTPIIMDTAPIVLPLQPPPSSPKKKVTFELDLRPSPRSPSRSPTRYAENITTAESPFGTTQNVNGKQRLSFHWRGGNCHEKVKMMKQKPQRTRRGSMHLLGCNKESDKGILSSTDNSLQVWLTPATISFTQLYHTHIHPTIRTFTEYFRFFQFGSASSEYSDVTHPVVVMFL